MLLGQQLDVIISKVFSKAKQFYESVFWLLQLLYLKVSVRKIIF